MTTDTGSQEINLARFSDLIARVGKGAVRSPDTLIASSGRHEIYYIPFSYVETRAKLVIVGITPGTTQLDLAYSKAQIMIRAGASESDVLRAVKNHGSFGGAMRTRLIRILQHFGFASLMGIEKEDDLWGKSAHLLHATSVVPHAAFVRERMFAGPFSEILRSPALRAGFEEHFIPELSHLRTDAHFIALGPTPLAALEHCADAGHIRRDQILGAIAHPSGSSGSEVAVYIREKALSDLSEGDPVRDRVPRLLDQADRMQLAVNRLRGNPSGLTSAAQAPASTSPVTPVLVPVVAKPVVDVIPKAAAPLEVKVATTPRPPASGSGADANARLHAVVARGKAAGTILRPHRYPDGCYVVSKSRFGEDYIRVPTTEALEGYLGQGYGLRMSAPGVSQSLIVPDSIKGRDV